MKADYVYTRPWLYPEQLDALFGSTRYAVVEATTKSGKTVGCMVWLAEQAMQGGPGDHYWWVAPSRSQAKIAYDRLKIALPRTLYVANDSALTLTLPTGSAMWFKTGENPDLLYGEDVKAVVIDEASRIREEAWHALRSTLTATRGPARIIGNVKGRKNWFYKMARRAESGDPDMHYAKITHIEAVAAGVLDAAEIDDARSQLPAQVFRELYEAEPSDDEGNPFGIEAIRACVAPLSTAEPVAWGWDLAKSVDWTVGAALDKHGHVCRFVRFQAPWPETKTRILRETGTLPALVDSTGVGDPIVDDLHKLGGRNFEGFQFSSSSKQKLMEGLAAAIQAQQIRFPGGVIVTELEAYEYQYTRTGVKYSAPEGMHDDCVCSLALVQSKVSVAVREWRAA